eukprot:350288-Chlamydomonas_euryale.AAC.1
MRRWRLSASLAPRRPCTCARCCCCRRPTGHPRFATRVVGWTGGSGGRLGVRAGVRCATLFVGLRVGGFTGGRSVRDALRWTLGARRVEVDARCAMR